MRTELHKFILSAGSMAAALMVLTGLSNVAHAAAPDLTSKDRLQILSEMADIVDDHYLDTEKADEVASALRTRKTRKGLAFDTPVTFAREATNLLYELSGDRHLSLKWAPGTSRKMAGSAGSEQHHGIRNIGFLPGNVGLLTLDRFFENTEARESLTAALFLLRDADALILDLRENRGGASDTVRLLQSCFFPEPTLVMYYEDEPGVLKPSLSEAPPADFPARTNPSICCRATRRHRPLKTLSTLPNCAVTAP